MCVCVCVCLRYRGLAITLRHTTLFRTPLDERSPLRRELYLKTRNTHNRQKIIPTVGFVPAIPASESPQVHALDRAATGKIINILHNNIFHLSEEIFNPNGIKLR